MVAVAVAQPLNAGNAIIRSAVLRTDRVSMSLSLGPNVVKGRDAGAVPALACYKHRAAPGGVRPIRIVLRLIRERGKISMAGPAAALLRQEGV